jgi:2,4-dienoyl-CoA reductase (NADPH2)
MTLRNRILMCPMGDALAEPDGTVSARQLAYYEARARGGVALIIVGSVAVDYPGGAFAAEQTALHTDGHIDGIAELAARVQHHGARLALQLTHGGPQSLHAIATGQPLLVPSPPEYHGPDRIARTVSEAEQTAMQRPFQQPASRVDLRVATEDDLLAAIEAFAAAASRAQRAGVDGIEVHGGHGYLLDAFRSPRTNAREDAWGGDRPRRDRLLLETVRAVRERVGDDFPMWCRFNSVEHHREPHETLDDALDLAPRLVEAGVDALHVSAYADPSVGVGITDAHTPHTPGALLAAAAAVRTAVDAAVPVITFGHLDPEVADEALAEGYADLVAMGRRLLADPDLPAKLAAGRVDEVRPCIYQYRCIGNIFLNSHVACVARPETAREEELALGPTATPERILVVGGGPAGLDAAWRLAVRGHDVVLREAGTHLGGRLAIAARGDEHLDRMLGWLLGQVARHEVELHLGRAASAADAVGFDRVVVATGGGWVRPAVPGVDLPHVRGLDDLATWTDEVDGPVVVVGGGKAGLTLARRARGLGHPVAVVEPGAVLAPELGLPGRFRWIADLEAAGVRLLPRHTVEGITGAAVAVTGPDGSAESIPASTVLVAAGGPVDDAFAATFRSSGVPVEVVGDARVAERLEGAFRDAAELAVRT